MIQPLKKRNKLAVAPVSHITTPSGSVAEKFPRSSRVVEKDFWQDSSVSCASTGDSKEIEGYGGPEDTLGESEAGTAPEPK